MYRAVFPIGDQWQELVIRFDELKGDDGSFDSTRKLLKVELQPSPDHQGSRLYLGEFGWQTHDVDCRVPCRAAVDMLMEIQPG